MVLPQRTSHRKTFSFVPSSWLSKTPQQQPSRSKTAPAPAPKGHELGAHAPSANSASPLFASPLSYPDLGISPPSLPKQIHTPLDKMKLARKVKKLSRIAMGDGPPVPGIEDPYLLTVASPEQLSPSPSTSSFAESQSQKGTGSLKRSATVGYKSDVPSLPHNVAVQRARSLAALQTNIAIPTAPPKARMSPISPVVFAHPDEDGIIPSETSSAFYSQSLIPSRAPSLIQEVDESALSDTHASGIAGHSPSEDEAKPPLRRDSAFSAALEEQESPACTPVRPAVKLTHKLGDSILPDVLLPAVSPPPAPGTSSLPALLLRPTSPSLPTASGTENTLLPQRSASLRRAKGSRVSSKRRLSLDLRALSPEPSKGAKLKKSRSTMISKKVVEQYAKDVLGRDDFEEGCVSRLGEPMSNKHRVLNVRRARKMVQLFGDKPPTELFQITAPVGAEETIDSISILTTVSENRRDSRATFASLTSSSISLTVHRRVRDSIQSSISEPPSPLVFTGAELEPDTKRSDPQSPSHSPTHPQPPMVAEAQPSSGIVQQQADETSDGHPRPISPWTPITPITPRAKPSIQSLSVASTASHTRSLSYHSQAPLNPQGYSHRRSHSQSTEPDLPDVPLLPRTPPPLSGLIQAMPTEREAQGSDAEWEREREVAHSPPPEEFRARRLRAAKLSRFFGVAPHDLVEALAGTPTPPSPTSQFGSHNNYSNASHPPLHDPLASSAYSKPLPNPPAHAHMHREEAAHVHGRKESMTVEVAKEIPRVFRLGRSEKKTVQELDMADVLDQLRRMR